MYQAIDDRIGELGSENQTVILKTVSKGGKSGVDA
jgi:hypothetical protein